MQVRVLLQHKRWTIGISSISCGNMQHSGVFRRYVNISRLRLGLYSAMSLSDNNCSQICSNFSICFPFLSIRVGLMSMDPYEHTVVTTHARRMLVGNIFIFCRLCYTGTILTVYFFAVDSTLYANISKDHILNGKTLSWDSWSPCNITRMYWVSKYTTTTTTHAFFCEIIALMNQD